MVLCRYNQPADAASFQLTEALLRAARGDIAAAVSLFADDARVSISPHTFDAPSSPTIRQTVPEFMRAGAAISTDPLYARADNSVEWTEWVVEPDRPTWENNMNAVMDGNESLWLNGSVGDAAHRYQRSVRLTAAGSRIRALSLAPHDQTGRCIALDSTRAVLPGYVEEVAPLVGLATALLWPARRSSTCPESTQRGRLIAGLRDRFVQDASEAFQP
jgi:hypothetical protein